MIVSSENAVNSRVEVLSDAWLDASRVCLCFFVAREPMYATICSEIKSVKSAIVMIKMKHVCKHNYLTIISNLNKKI